MEDASGQSPRETPKPRRPIEPMAPLRTAIEARGRAKRADGELPSEEPSRTDSAAPSEAAWNKKVYEANSQPQTPICACGWPRDLRFGSPSGFPAKTSSVIGTMRYSN
jgi:hypothetical protein